MISKIEFRVSEIINLKNPKDSKREFDLMHKLDGNLKIAGLNVLRCCFLDRFTFLDYIHAGCEISTIIGMDFTLSNKPANNPKSLHYINPLLWQYYNK